METRSLRTRFIEYPKESMGYYFYLPKDHNVIMSHHAILLENFFFQDGGTGRKIELEKKIFEEHRVQEPESISELVDVVPLLLHGSSRIFHPPERYLNILTENLEETFFVRDRNIRNDPKIYDEAMLDVDFKK